MNGSIRIVTPDPMPTNPELRWESEKYDPKIEETDKQLLPLQPVYYLIPLE